MGPFFVFIRRSVGIVEHSFDTLFEAQAFYYGVRELKDRNVRRQTSQYPVDDIVWMSCDMNDVMSEGNILGHYTIYARSYQLSWAQAELSVYLDRRPY